MHVVIVGGGAALAQPVIRHYLDKGADVTAICRKTKPEVKAPRLRVLDEWQPLLPIDVLITMTGSTADARLTEMSPMAWDTVVGHTLRSAFEAFRYGLPQMVDGGSVVVVGSVVGSTGAYGAANYAAAKAGLVGLVRSAALEVAKRGITVNLLELGYVNEGMGARLDAKTRERALASIPLKRFAEPQEVVEAIDWLARAKYLTGDVVPFAGGLR